MYEHPSALRYILSLYLWSVICAATDTRSDTYSLILYVRYTPLSGTVHRGPRRDFIDTLERAAFCCTLTVHRDTTINAHNTTKYPQNKH